MGAIGGSEWNAPGLLTTRLMNQLQSPTISLSDGTLTANSLFNTGLATQLSPQFAMAIHAIRWNLDISSPTAAQDMEDTIITVLTEDSGATSAAAELTDARTLAEAGIKYAQANQSSVGEQILVFDSLWTAKFAPPIWTIAQRLNIVGDIIEAGGGTAPDLSIHCKLYYTVEQIDETFSRELVQRLNLSVQP